jgi:hypothetical protein
MNIHAGIGDLLMTKNIVRNLRAAGYNEQLDLYIDFEKIQTYRNTFFGLTEQDCRHAVLNLAKRILEFEDEKTTVSYGSGYEDYDHERFFDSFRSSLPSSIPLRTFHLGNSSIDLPSHYITVNTKAYGFSYSRWETIKELFVDFLNRKEVEVLLLGDNTYDDNYEYSIHNKENKNIFVMYDDMKKIEKTTDLTFRKKGDLLDVALLERNMYIMRHAKLNIVFSNGGALFMSVFSGKTISFTDTKNKYLESENYERVDSLEQYTTVGSFMSALENHLS